MKIDRRSLTVRLTLLFALASTLVLVLIGYALYVSLDRHFLHEDAVELRGKTELLGNLLARMRTPDDFTRLSSSLHDALVGHSNLSLELRSPDGRLLFKDHEAAIPDASAVRHERRDEIEGLDIETVRSQGHRFRIAHFALPTGLADVAQVRGDLVMNIDHHEVFMANIQETVLVAVVIGAFASVLLGWLAVRLGIAPLRAFSSLASGLSAERLNDRVDLAQLPPELSQLGDSFNAMLARLQDSFRRLKEFSTDIAHELRTPISVLMTQAQVALSRPRTSDAYREVIYSALEEYDRLARMINDMLFLARADHGLVVPAEEATHLRAEVDALFEFYDALVETKRITLRAIGDAAVKGDRLMIRRGISNLLSNAIRHADEHSTITVEIASPDQRTASLVVTNDGDPIPAEHLPRLFDRLYRVDASRGRSSDGAGLGLSITKSIVDAHGGTITVQSEGRRTRFEIRLPALVA